MNSSTIVIELIVVAVTIAGVFRSELDPNGASGYPTCRAGSAGQFRRDPRRNVTSTKTATPKHMPAAISPTTSTA